MKITYENFRELDLKYMKYISIISEKFILSIIDFNVFRETLCDDYPEEKIQYFFKIFPYLLEPITEKDIEISIELEIEYYDDLQSLEFDGEKYVLFNMKSVFGDNWDFPHEIKTQPIPFTYFVSIAFEEFVEFNTEGFLETMDANLKEASESELDLRWEHIERQSLYS
jgi:hypothetical protein